MAISTKNARDRRGTPQKSKGEARLCIATVYAHESRNSLPIEIDFPQISEAEDARIRSELEKLVRRLGYKPLWVPII